MSSAGEVRSGSEDGGARQGDRADQTHRKNWSKAKKAAYYPRDPKFPLLGERENSGRPLVPPILVFFNAKGGTLKTSHTWNIAYTMSSELRGLKVLTVDMDSQRDLTRLMLKAMFRQQAAAGVEQTIWMQQHLTRPFTDAEVNTYAYHDLPASDQHFGAGGLSRTLEGALRPMMADIPYVKRVVPEQITPRLFLLPGSSVMEGIDRRLTISEGFLSQPNQRNWQGGPLHVIMEAARAVEADIVLLDLNPSLSTINRNMVMSSDYIVFTTRPEDDGLENIETFVNTMILDDPVTEMYGGSWLQQMIHLIRPEVNFTRQPGSLPRYRLPETVPKVLGCVIADYCSKETVEHTMNPARPADFLSTQTNGLFRDLPAGAVQNRMDRTTTRMIEIMDKISNIGVKAPPAPTRGPTKHVRMTVDSGVYQEAKLTCLLASIRSHETLGPVSHHSGVPVPFIEQQHCIDVETETHLSADRKRDMVKRALDFKRRYDQLAWNILKLMNTDSEGKMYGRFHWALQDRRDLAGGPTRPDDSCPHAPQGVQLGYCARFPLGASHP